MAKTTASKKAKGRKHQQWTRDELLKRFPALEKDDIRSISMGASGEDLLLSPAAKKLIPYSFECKSLARFAGYKFMKQAESNTSEGMQPIAVVKANRERPLVLIDAEYFFDLISKE